ncbi:hypothetical protein BH11PSE4_BH11PSE4_40950 [soil metagenome]
MVFCAEPSYLERRGRPATADDLAAHDCILYGHADGRITWRFHREDGPVERRPVEGRIVLGSAEAQVGAVVAGFGIAQLATWLIKDQLRSGELVEVLPDLATAGLPLEIVWPRSRQLLPKVDALIALLKSRISID